jgi:UDP-GlcNAc:undecaprenyl-phosphate GlcNAc-1-phosphate transferase
MDVPQANHKGHGRSTPLLGGAAMFTGWIACLGCGLAAALYGGETLPGFSGALAMISPESIRRCRSSAFSCWGRFLAVLLGLVDDMYALSAGVKFGGQFLIAVLAVWLGGVRVNIFSTEPVLVWSVSVFGSCCS